MAVNGARGLPPEEYVVSNDGMFFWMPDGIDYGRIVARHFVGQCAAPALPYRLAPCAGREPARGPKPAGKPHLMPMQRPNRPSSDPPDACPALRPPFARAGAGAPDVGPRKWAPCCSWSAWRWRGSCGRQARLGSRPRGRGYRRYRHPLQARRPIPARGLANLVRADLFAILSFYFLTLFEFLFPQANYDKLVTAHDTIKAIIICLWAFAGLAIGRHLGAGQGAALPADIDDADLLRPDDDAVPCCVTLGGYANMLVACKFNVFEMVDAFMWPRFSQPWSRGRFGNWTALFDEIGMILFLIPPMAGIILARRRNYTIAQLAIVFATLLFTLFYGYSSGTRHIFDSYLVTFLIGYAFATHKARRHELLYVAAACAALLLFSTVTMVKFREVGLKGYLDGTADIEEVKDPDVLAVDLNLYPLSEIAAAFPARHGYLGLEIIYQALIRPIPRAIWHGKPEGMSVSIESVVGAGAEWTVAASFAGEAYMSGGLVAVFVIAAGFGWLAAWWNRLVSEENSELGWLIYASGFFAVVISMRSLLVLTTAILPTVAAFAAASYVIGKGVDGLRRVIPGRRRAPVPVRARPAPAIPRR